MYLTFVCNILLIKIFNIINICFDTSVILSLKPRIYRDSSFIRDKILIKEILFLQFE